MKIAFRILILCAALSLVIVFLQPFLSPASRSADAGKQAFQAYCSSCHGNPENGNWSRFKRDQLDQIVNGGLGNRMPKFDYLPNRTKKEMVDYLLSIKKRSDP